MAKIIDFKTRETLHDEPQQILTRKWMQGFPTEGKVIIIADSPYAAEKIWEKMKQTPVADMPSVSYIFGKKE